MSKGYMTKKEKEKELILNTVIILLVFVLATVVLIGWSLTAEVDTEDLIDNAVTNSENSTGIDLSGAENFEEESELVTQEAINQVLDTLGKDSSDLNKVYDEDGNILSNTVKTIKAFRTLAEAEEYMGYYLGLHNTLECIDGYELVQMSSVGNDDWMQALYQGENLDDYPDFTVKVSKESSLDILLSAFDLDNGYPIKEIKNIYDVKVTVLGKISSDENVLNLSYFSTDNGKNYVINCGGGMTRDNMLAILSELISNLQIMDDWT